MFIKTLNKINVDGFDSIETLDESYTYENYVDDMYKYGQSIQECICDYCKTVNIIAVSLLTESSVSNADIHSIKTHEASSLIEKLKKIWEQIKESTEKILITISDMIYGQFVSKTARVRKHKEEIMKNTIIFQKESSSNKRSPEAKDELLGVQIKEKIDLPFSSKVINSPVYSIKSYKDILTPIILKLENIDRFADETGRIDKTKLKEAYMKSILGSTDKTSEIPVVKINKSKDKLFNILDILEKTIKDNKKAIKEINKDKNPPKNPEELEKFRLKNFAIIDNLKCYNAVLDIVTRETVKILEMFLKPINKEDVGGLL